MSDTQPDVHERYMALAYGEAEKALALDEVPVGAVIVQGGEVIGTGHNLTRTDQDPTAHAEMVAIRKAAAKLGSWWLEDCALYVTLEPCAMCGGGIVLARLSHLVYGATDPKAGACGSLRHVVSDDRLNHRVKVVSGVMADDCGQILKSFFKSKRNR